MSDVGKHMTGESSNIGATNFCYFFKSLLILD